MAKRKCRRRAAVKINPESLKEYGREVLRDYLKNLVEKIMYAERERYLEDTPEDRGNGDYKRVWKTSFGEIVLKIPRTRNSKKFKPKMMPSRFKKEDKEFENLVIKILLNPTSRDGIKKVLDKKGVKLNDVLMKSVQNFLESEFGNLNERKLNADYKMVYIDNVEVELRNGKKPKKANIYVLTGVGMRNTKEFLGYFLCEGKTTKDFWENIFNRLKERGFKKAREFVCRDYPGVEKVLDRMFPAAEIKKI